MFYKYNGWEGGHPVSPNCNHKSDFDRLHALELVKGWACIVGRKQKEAQGRKNIRLDTKSSHIDLVTEIDLSSEQFLIDAIHRHFPHHAILSEEAGREDVTSDYLWIIDPLDGTTNYAQGLPIYSVSIALQFKQETILGVIYVPSLEQMFEVSKGQQPRLNNREIFPGTKTELKDCVFATGFPYDRATHEDNNLNYFARIVPKIRGIVRMGSAAYDLACVAAGFLDGFWELNLGPWDVAAGALMVQEAGGEVIYLPHKRGVSLVAGNKQICPQILQELFDEDRKNSSAMKTIALLSTPGGTGKTTLAVHLATGFKKLGLKVLLVDGSENDGLCRWLEIVPCTKSGTRLIDPPPRNSSLISLIASGPLELDVLPWPAGIKSSMSGALLHKHLHLLHYDLVILDMGPDSGDIESASAMADYIMVPINLRQDQEADDLAVLDQAIKTLSRQQKELHLMVPVNINTREWADNSRRLFTLVDIFGADKIADIIGSCARINDLPEQHKTAWQLTQPHITAAFDRLVEQVRQALGW